MSDEVSIQGIWMVREGNGDMAVYVKRQSEWHQVLHIPHDRSGWNNLFFSTNYLVSINPAPWIANREANPAPWITETMSNRHILRSEITKEQKQLLRTVIEAHGDAVKHGYTGTLVNFLDTFKREEQEG